ncbi:MAG: hypothetical protein PVSMB6_09070 [Steroidobacteraceae bacterium]
MSITAAPLTLVAGVMLPPAGLRLHLTPAPFCVVAVTLMASVTVRLAANGEMTTGTVPAKPVVPVEPVEPPEP